MAGTVVRNDLSRAYAVTIGKGTFQTINNEKQKNKHREYEDFYYCADAQ